MVGRILLSESAEVRVKMSRRAWLRDQKAAEAEAEQTVAAE